MKVSRDEMVLHLPFDEAVGSSRAYNYAPNRTANNDVTLTEECVITEDAVFGNALHIGTNGECYIGQDLINTTGEFTLSAFIKSTGNEIAFLMIFPSGHQQHYHTASVSPSQWFFVAIQRVLVGSTYYVRFYLDEQIVYNAQSSGVPTGCSFGAMDGSEVTIDELRAWNRSLSLTEIFTLQRENDDVEYYVDGVNFKTHGVEVSKANGLLDELERKEPLRVDWDGAHGEVIDLSRPHWNRREISLECFIVASSNTAFVRSLNRFMAQFRKAGTQRLTCEYAGTVKPLEYDVYRDEKVEVDKNWNDELMVGTFTLVLIEPQPIKMVLKHICQSANSTAWFQCQTYKMLTVSWGDQDTSCTVNDTDSRTKSTNLHGTPIKVAHTYAAAGEYDIVIHGNIEEITDFTTNCILVYGADGNI